MFWQDNSKNKCKWCNEHILGSIYYEDGNAFCSSAHRNLYASVKAYDSRKYEELLHDVEHARSVS